MTHEEILKEMGYQLESIDMIGAKGRIVRGVRTGNLIFISGALPRYNGQEIKGKVDNEISIEEGYRAAQWATINCLRVIKTMMGSLDSITQFIKVFGMVNVAHDFDDPPAIINGCSDLLLTVFGEKGRHARSAVGVFVPHNYAVEIEMIVEVSTN